MTGIENEALYRRYIRHLNDRPVADLDEFVHDSLIYNGKEMTRIEYQNLIADGIAALPDLYFDIHLLAVDGDLVACRLRFDCTMQGEFLGLKASGTSIAFAEHVFYRLRDGKIRDVWSLIDRSAIEAQLSV